MTTNDQPSSVLVVRAWQLPDGPLCARVGTVGDPWHGPSRWQLCVGREQTLLVVRTWLDHLMPDASLPPHTAGNITETGTA